MLPRRLRLLPLTVLMFTQSLGGATVASVSGSTFGRSCTAQTSNTAQCSVIYEPPPPNDAVGGAIVNASAAPLSLSGDIEILSSNRPSEAVGGEGEFSASFSGLVTIQSLTGATGLGLLTGELDIVEFSDPPVGFDFSLTYGDDVRSGHMDSTHKEGLFTEFTFGKPFPLAAEITASISSQYRSGLHAVFEIHNLFVESPEGGQIPSTITYVESPVPEPSTSWLVLAGLPLLPIRRVLRNR